MVSIAFHRFYFGERISTVPFMTTTTLENLSWTVADRGIHADAPGVQTFATAASSRKLSPVLISVLLDETAPEPVRERAFGLLAARFV
jgi:hypothetical protein